MKSDSDEDLISSIAEDVMKCLSQCGFFQKLDDVLCPKGGSQARRKCCSNYEIPKEILVASEFTEADLADIFGVLKSKGGHCDCEILYNVAESSSLRETHWRNRASQLHGESSSVPERH
jgi:hypothetical protein